MGRAGAFALYMDSCLASLSSVRLAWLGLAPESWGPADANPKSSEQPFGLGLGLVALQCVLGSAPSEARPTVAAAVALLGTEALMRLIVPSTDVEASHGGP